MQLITLSKGFTSALPAHYNRTSIEYPLLVFIHGGGQVGNGDSELPLVLNEGVPELLSWKAFPPNFTVNGKNFSFVILAPQFTQYPSNYEVETFIDYGINNYRVDKRRIYLSGLSMGGVVTADVGAEFTNQLAAIVPISGVSNTYGTDIIKKCKTIAETNLPVWGISERR